MMNKIITTNKKAITGTKIESTDMNADVPVSTVETMGFPSPPVVAVDAKRVVPADPEIAAAVPPPGGRRCADRAAATG